MELLTKRPVPLRTRPETITPLQVRCILRALANAGIPCEVRTYDGPVFVGASPAEVIAAAAGVPSIRVNWLKVVRVKHEQGLDLVFSSPLLTWAGDDSDADR